MICAHPDCNKYTTGKYCTNKCQGKHSSLLILEAWKAGDDPGYKKGFRLKNAVRAYILEKYDHRCSECGWNKINPTTGKSPLEIDHIDGDCTNSKEDNLRVLCPNCHSLTSTWKALNIGKGNKQRLSYSGLIAPLAQ